MEGGRAGGRHARADLGRRRRGPGVQPPRQGRHVQRRQDRRRAPTRPTTTGSCCPGGVANPDFLRTDEDAVAFVRAFFEQAKPVGVICHGPWTLVEADVVRGRTLTSWPSLQDRPRERGRDLGRRGGPRRRGPDELAQPGRPARVLREDRRGVRRGQARRPGAQRRLAHGHGGPGHRRHAGGHELPPRDRLVPGVPARRLRPAAVAHPPAHRDGRRPAGRRPRRRGLRPRARRRRARGREGPLRAS